MRSSPDTIVSSTQVEILARKFGEKEEACEMWKAERNLLAVIVDVVQLHSCSVEIQCDYLKTSNNTRMPD